MPSCNEIAALLGSHLLFLGVETATWNNIQFMQAADFARSHHVDNLLLKVADGTNLWYGGMSGFKSIASTIHSQGVGCIPYTYSYCNKFGALDTEVGILLAFMQECGVVVMDAEQEWNGQVNAAQHLCSRMQSAQGSFLVSTWADPDLQNWQGVIQALNPCVSAYMPQQYTNYLASCWPQFAAAGAACLQPTIDMTQDFGPNDAVSIAKAAHDQGHTAISVWHYETAAANPSLLDAIYAAFPKGAQAMTIDLTTPRVSNYFESSGDLWHCKQTGFLVGQGILAFYQKFGGDALCGLTYLGLPLSNELPVSGRSGVVYQHFERAVAVYDPGRLIDNPPGSTGSVYLAHIDSGIGEDPRITGLQGQIAALQQSALAMQILQVQAKLQQIVQIAST